MTTVRVGLARWRRRMRLLLAAVIAILVAAIGTPAPGTAAPPATIRPYLPDVVLARTVTQPVWLLPGDFYTDATLSFDTGDLAGVATAQFGGDCTTEGATTTCRLGNINTQDRPYLWDNRLALAPADGAAPGATGTIVVTAAADGVTGGRHEATVTVGRPVNFGFVYDDLRAVQLTSRAGATFQVPIRLRVGSGPVQGAALTFEPPAELRKVNNFSNCRYTGDGPVSCEFPVVLQAGVTYRFAQPLAFGVDEGLRGSYAVTAGGRFVWMTTAEYQRDLERRRTLGLPLGSYGTGAALTLQPVGAATGPAVDPGDADLDDGDNWLDLGLTLYPANATDFAAVGTRVGSTRTVRVGVTNRGPNTSPAGVGKAAVIFFSERSGAARHPLDSYPAGCTFVPESLPTSYPDGPWYPDVPVSHWICTSTAELRVGQTWWLTFVGPFEPSKGHIDVSSGGPDLNPANDRADIIIGATAVPTTRPPGRPTGNSATRPAPPTAGGSGLASTGTRVIGIIGLGLALVLVGLLTIRVANRRRG